MEFYNNELKGAVEDNGGNSNCEISCTLTTAELRHRKETVIAGLKAQVVEKKELDNGYAFRFDGSDKILDELIEFIKTERACCNFFNFDLSVRGDESNTWLAITGVKGVKDFILTELNL